MSDNNDSPAHFSALLLGGANSGKTACSLAWAKRFAQGQGEILEERLEDRQASLPTYIATAKFNAHDASLAERIKKHQAERGEDFVTLEQPDPLNLVSSLQSCKSRMIIVDCLTLFLSALLFSEGDARITEQGESFERVVVALEAFLNSIAHSERSVIFVSNEVGLGIVPYTKMGEVFRGYAGILHQRIAACVPVLALVVAGVPLLIKGSAPVGGAALKLTEKG